MKIEKFLEIQTDFSSLGKTEEDGSKTYLSWDKHTGWGIRKLNWYHQKIRCLFQWAGAYSDTVVPSLLEGLNREIQSSPSVKMKPLADRINKLALSHKLIPNVQIDLLIDIDALWNKSETMSTLHRFRELDELIHLSIQKGFSKGITARVLQNCTGFMKLMEEEWMITNSLTCPNLYEIREVIKRANR